LLKAMPLSPALNQLPDEEFVSKAFEELLSSHQQLAESYAQHLAAPPSPAPSKPAARPAAPNARHTIALAG
jgi:hypothetical protein